METGQGADRRGKAGGVAAVVIGALPWFADKGGVEVSPYVVFSGGLLMFFGLGYSTWEWLRGWHRVVAAIAATAIFVAGATWMCSRSYYLANPAVKPLEEAQWRHPNYNKTIQDRTFTNENVVLDGVHFLRCRFQNVTFIYNATAPTLLTQPTYVGSVALYSTKLDVNYAMILVAYMHSTGPIGVGRVPVTPQ